MSNGFPRRGPVPQELITMHAMHVLVLGAGPTGLVAAMVLAKEGHRVTVVDQDPPPPPVGGRDRVFADWKRPGVGQFSVAHILLPAGYGRPTAPRTSRRRR
jgi:phytoene dehydrogenase-like protein